MIVDNAVNPNIWIWRHVVAAIQTKGAVMSNTRFHNLKGGRRIVRSALILVALGGSQLALGVAPVSAGTTSCSVTGYNPTTNGVTSYSTSLISCTGQGVNAGRIESKHQENYLGVWNDRATENKFDNQVALAVTASYNCNGHGTDNYRTRAYGKDQNDNNKTSYSSTRSLTC